MHIGTTLTNYIIEAQRHIQGATGEFTGLLNDVAVACKKISDLVNKGNLVGVLGVAGTENVQGEEQKKLDVITNEVFIEALENNGHVAAMASEEMEDVYNLPDGAPRGHYLLTFDPLDGSSNIDVNVSVGTIFSILKAPKGVENPTAEDFLQPGTTQVAAGYCLYGPSTMMVLTTGQGVNMFTLDRDFDNVLAACAAPRGDGLGTWITREMKSAYQRLHALGWAHSVECWQDERLVGGLYGVALGRVFFGESMFSRTTDASKVALVHLARQLQRWGFALIDCQVDSPHLRSLGARSVARSAFVQSLARFCTDERPVGPWTLDVGLAEHLQATGGRDE